MKQISVFNLLFLAVLIASCANSEKQAGTASYKAEMEAAATQLANDMCSAKQAVVKNPDDPQKMEEYNRISKELDDRFNDLLKKYSSEDDVKKLNDLISNMTANCVK